MKSTPEVRCSYLNLITPKDSEDGKSSAWQGTALFDKKDPVHMAWLKETAAEYNELLEKAYPDLSKRPRIPFIGHEKSPCKDGDTGTNSMGIPYKEKNPEYEGHYFLRFGAVAKSTDAKTGAVRTFVRKHRVVSTTKTNGRLDDITDETLVYGGCWGRFGGNFYVRKRTDNPGISVSLGNFQKTRDDEPFGVASVRAEDVFDDAGANDPNNYQADPFADGSGL